MTIERQALTPLTVALSVLTALALVWPGALSAQSHQPPPEPPAEWGPISINMEEIEYPHPVEFMNVRVYGQDVRIAYMDVAPAGPANGRAVVFHHGGSYYGWYWKEQIEALTNAGYRVIVKDRLGWGKSSKPILPYSMSLHASNTARLMGYLGISQAAIVGHSIGGQMATRFAFLYPEMTTHLVTMNQIGLTDNRAGRWFRPFDGEIDGPNFPETARRAVKILPHAELFLIPNVGHNPHEEVPDIVNAELIRFLGSDLDEPAAEGGR